jgi:hypothetical protein
MVVIVVIVGVVVENWSVWGAVKDSEENVVVVAVAVVSGMHRG